MAAMDPSKTRNSTQGLLRSPVTPPASPPLPPISPEGKAKIDVLIEELNSLDVSPNEILSLTSEQEDHLKECFRTACINGETLKYAVERLHMLCLSDKSIIAKVAASFNVVQELEVDRIKMRSLLLGCLEKDYTNRHEMQAQTPDKFLNAVALLGQIFARVRIGKLPISALSYPVMEYLEALLTGDESEIELFAHLLITISPALLEDEIKEAVAGSSASLASCSALQKLITKVRSTLMSRNLSCQSRLWLLFIMDITSSGNLVAPSSSLQSFYKDKDNLGSEAEVLLKSFQLNQPSGFASSPDVDTPRVEKSSHKREDPLPTSQMSHINISPKSKDSVEKSGNNVWKKGSPDKPGNADKRENFRSAFQVESNKGKGSKGYWLHDDRFDKEEPTSSMSDRSSKGITKPRAVEGNWRQPPNSREKESREKETRPRTNDSSWRQSQSNKPSKEVPASSSVSNTDNILAGHVLEEVWD